jgi:hypothetical protein
MRRIFKGLWWCLLLTAPAEPALVSSRFSPSQARTPAFRERKLTERKLAERKLTMTAEQEERAMTRRVSMSNTGWLLEPDVYGRLSSGGQVAVRFINGLYRPEQQRDAESQTMVPAAQPFGPGQNINLTEFDGAGKTQSETSIAVNGGTIVESFNDTTFPALYGLSSYAISTNGGMTFFYRHLGQAEAEINLGDGVVAFGPEGELYFSEIAVGLDGVFIGVQRAPDGVNFRTITNASTTAVNSKDFQDKPWIAVDKSPASRFKGNVYVSWTDFTLKKGAFIDVAVSTNGARSFNEPVAVTPKGKGVPVVQGSVPAVAPNGDLYVAYLDMSLSPAGISIVRSTDGGSTFDAPKTVATFNPVGPMTGGETVRTNSFPSLSVDDSGNLHIAFNAQSLLPGPDRSDIYYTRSTDGGSTFTAPRRMNDDNTTTSQFFPSVATSNGAIGIKWFDRRNDPSNDLLTDVYMAISHDGGSNFGPNLRITDHNWVFGPVEDQLAEGYHGDYDGLATDGTNFYVSWSDERGRDPDAYVTFIPVTAEPGPDFNISVNKVFDTAPRGGLLKFEVSTTASGGFTDNLSLSASTVLSVFGPPLLHLSHDTIPVGERVMLTIEQQFGDCVVDVKASGGGINRGTNVTALFGEDVAGATAPSRLTQTSGFTAFSSGFKLDSRGVSHGAFDDDTGVAGGSRVYYMNSSDGGRTYSTPLAITSSSEISFNSAISVDRADNIYVAWTRVGGGPARILISKSTDHGISFSSPIAITPSTQVADFARVAAGPSGAITCSYLDFTGNSPRLFMVRSTDGATSFSTPIQISLANEVVDLLGHGLEADSADRIYAVYVDDSETPSVKLALLSPAGVLARNTIVSDPSVPSFAPDLTIGKDGEVYVVFYSVFAAGQPGENREVMFSKSCDLGESFSVPLNVSQTSTQSRFPSVAVDRNGVVYVAWEDKAQNSKQDIYVAFDITGGASFHAINNFSNTRGFSTASKLTVDANNNVMLAWSDDSPGEPDLFATVIPGYPQITDPAFGISPISTEPVVRRKSSIQLPLYILRVGGFSDVITVSAPDTRGLKVIVSPTTQSTSCNSVTFNIKVKKHARPGRLDLTFIGSDSRGNTVTTLVPITIQ